MSPAKCQCFTSNAATRLREVSGETPPVAAREWVTNSGHSKECPACLVSWPTSRCFSVAANTVCCGETIGHNSSSVAAELCTRVAELTLKQSVPAGNHLVSLFFFYLHVSELFQTGGRAEDVKEANHLQGAEGGKMTTWGSDTTAGNKSSCSTHVFVFHVLEQPQLSVRPLGVDDGLKGPRQLLDGDLQAGLQIICWTVRDGRSQGLPQWLHLHYSFTLMGAGYRPWPSNAQGPTSIQRRYFRYYGYFQLRLAGMSGLMEILQNFVKYVEILVKFYTLFFN